MKAFAKANALNASELPHTVVLKYYHEGVLLYLPVERWEKMMRYLQRSAQSIAHRGVGCDGGVVFQKKVEK